MRLSAWTGLPKNMTTTRQVPIFVDGKDPVLNSNVFFKDIDQVLADGVDIGVGTTTGTKVGTATTQKLGFWGVAPVVQPTALTVADASTIDATYGAEEQAVLGNIRTRLNELVSKLQAIGLIA